MTQAEVHPSPVDHPVLTVDVSRIGPVGTLEPARAAAVYARAGFQPIPLYGLTPDRVCRCARGAACDAPGKHPRLRGWQLAATSDEAAVAAHGWSAANVGLAMGGLARLVAVDIDGEDGRTSLATLEGAHGPLPPTLTLETGRVDGGEHRIFVCPIEWDMAAIKNRVGGIGRGLDVRASGGQIVAPPSTHASGRRYRWTRLVQPAMLPAWLFGLMAGAALPSQARAARAALAEVTAASVAAAPAPTPRATPPKRDRVRAWASAALDAAVGTVRAAPAGERNATLNREAYSVGQLVAGGVLGEGEATAALAGAARSAGLEEEETRKTIRSAFDGARSTPRSTPPERPRPEPTPTPPDATGRPALVRGDHVELADRLVEELAGAGPLVCTDGDLWRYDVTTGLWGVVPIEESARIVASYAGAPIAGTRRVKSLSASDVTGTVSLAKSLHHRAAHFDAAPIGIAFRNGFLQLTSDGLELRPHGPENAARHGYAWDYAVGHGAGAWLSFLHDLFRDDIDAPEKIDFLQEFVGSALLGIGPRFGVAAVLVGDGANGKSTLLEVLQAIMPPGSTCAIPPQLWGQEYRRALFVGKRLNAVSELPEADILDSESFKAIITGDLIDARRIREAPFSFKPTAAHMFAANRLPGTNDQTDGFWRRFVVLTFNRAFKGSDAVPNLARGLIEHERPGIVQWALEGAHALVARGMTVNVPTSDTVKGEWRRVSDPVACFVEEMTEPVLEGPWGRAMSLYRSYVTWCSTHGHRHMSSTKFGMRLRGLKVESRHTSDGNVYSVRVKIENL